GKKENKSAANNQSGNGSTLQLKDNRPVTVAQRKLQKMADCSPQTEHTALLQAKTSDASPNNQQTIQKKDNKTGLPDNLKSGVENLSGYSMDDVKVHRNSDKPAQLNAHAYAQGTDIHLAPGQEKHLPHEVWHVVQQKQGRVKPTKQLKDKVNINDDAGLEKEGDVMGVKAMGSAKTKYEYFTQNTGNNLPSAESLILSQSTNNGIPQLKKVTKPERNRLTVAGEYHNISGSEIRRLREREIVREETGGGYWLEQTFKYTEPNKNSRSGDSSVLRYLRLVKNIQGEKSDGEPIPDVRNLEQVKKNHGLLTKVCQEIKDILAYHKSAFMEDFGDHLAKISGAINAFDMTYEAVQGYLDKMISPKASFDFKETLSHLTNNLKGIENNLNIIMGTQNLGLDGIDFKRSESMHRAAKYGAHQHGVWKVGNSHVIQLPDEESGYDYMTAAKFKAFFDEKMETKPSDWLYDKMPSKAAKSSTSSGAEIGGGEQTGQHTMDKEDDVPSGSGTTQSEDNEELQAWIDEMLDDILGSQASSVDMQEESRRQIEMEYVQVSGNMSTRESAMAELRRICQKYYAEWDAEIKAGKAIK
ncbi:MAG: DUF4157 domain-containing protein, partial [Cyclobacteriaceae bacterium]